MSRRLGAKLLAEVSNAPSIRPRLTPAKVLAYAVATVVHVATLATALSGIALLFLLHFNPVSIVAAVVLFLMAFELRPRVTKLRSQPVPPSKVPELYRLTARVASDLQTKNIHHVLIAPDFNAAMGQVGWRRQKVLYLGLPLFLSLGSQERVALVGHELAHRVNGDANRGFFIGTALTSLSTWYQFLRSPLARRPAMWEWFGIALAHLASYVPAAGVRTLSHLNWYESQRAEYLADALSAQMAGGNATISMLTTLSHGSAFAVTVHQLALSNRMNELFPELHDRLSAADASVSTSARPGAAGRYRLDATHPPTPNRIAFLRTRSNSEPRIKLSPDHAERLERELAQFRPDIEKQLQERYLRSLYR